MGARRRRHHADPGTQREGAQVVDSSLHVRDHRGREDLLTLRRRFQPVVWQIAGDRVLTNEDHTLVMGVLNVTPDSFSDGGEFFEYDDAIARGLQMVEQGADLIDVGGESTRPGSEGVDEAEEMRRVVPVVESLASQGVIVSIDSSKASVAEAAIESGAAIVNDVTSFGDRAMAAVLARSGAGLVLMHMQGAPRTMQDEPRYDDVVREVHDFLLGRAALAVSAGVDRGAICLDPGIGFGKDLGHNLDLLAAGVPVLAETGHPVLVGASRKSFLAKILGNIPMEARDGPTGSVHALAIAGGAAVIRVHNVVEGLRSARVADAIVRGIP